MLRALYSPRRLASLIFVTLVFCAVALSLVNSSPEPKSNVVIQKPFTDTQSDASEETKNTTVPWDAPPQRDIHILMTATDGNVNMCKTLMSMTILGYPSPQIIAWGDSNKNTTFAGGGSHLAKITRGLEYVNDEERTQRPEFEDELIFMIDSYDVWFQLPVHTLIDRYHAAVREENTRVAHRLGNAYDAEGINSQIVFGGGKRCAPNLYHTMACYATPESPIPYDLRGSNTDTVLGRTDYSSFRTRYLNAGYMIGPVREMRLLFERAQEKLSECIIQEEAEWDNDLKKKTNFCYAGSDQSIFADIFGEQEFQREIMRRHHRSKTDDYLDSIVSNRAGAKPPQTHIMNVPINDMLRPDFPHQKNDTSYLLGKPHEFGIMLDYWSALGHQTMHSEFDYRFIKHDRPLGPQVGELGWFDCHPGLAPMPDDLPGGTIEFLKDTHRSRWETLPLYTEICVGQVPVMLHHNNVNKKPLVNMWNQTWWYGSARFLMDKRRELGATQLIEGIPAEGNGTLAWDEICPRDYDAELYRDNLVSQPSHKKDKPEKTPPKKKPSSPPKKPSPPLKKQNPAPPPKKESSPSAPKKDHPPPPAPPPAPASKEDPSPPGSAPKKDGPISPPPGKEDEPPASSDKSKTQPQINAEKEKKPVQEEVEEKVSSNTLAEDNGDEITPDDIAEHIKENTPDVPAPEKAHPQKEGTVQDLDVTHGPEAPADTLADAPAKVPEDDIGDEITPQDIAGDKAEEAVKADKPVEEQPDKDKPWGFTDEEASDFTPGPPLEEAKPEDVDEPIIVNSEQIKEEGG